MNEFNFDNMKNFNTPDEWAEKAIKIPEISEKNDPLLFFRFTRSFAVAASFMLVCALGVLLFIFKPDENILPIDPNATTAIETVNASHSVEPTGTTEGKNKEKKPFWYEVIEPTESKHSGTNHSTESPTEKSTSATEKIEPTEKLTETNPVTQPTTTQSTTKPTVKPTQKPTVKPTQKPTQKPTVKPTQKPTVNISTPDPVICTGSYSNSGNSWETASIDIFCKLYDSNGNLVGDKDLYSFQHEATIDSIYGDIVYVSYEPASKGLSLAMGRYSFYFYDYFGKVVAQGYVTVR